MQCRYIVFTHCRRCCQQESFNHGPGRKSETRKPIAEVAFKRAQKAQKEGIALPILRLLGFFVAILEFCNCLPKSERRPKSEGGKDDRTPRNQGPVSLAE